ncbi:hypothetical protein [Aurantiacibacter spongiae]|uniref:Uncharacterized protein n=1 Tax=Aurantiacibacter spongiae TaxID=2488860 RepID=A0A3N5CUE6_9SPHN|nr:hypothetical protein [Aurantiacibacter spongiae]RPF70239.1 hypothetical protein EG799_00285 [Aurantiacibacter spongiae]
MFFRKALFGLASSGLMLGSTMAAAAPSASPITGEREATPITQADDMGGMGLGWLIALLVAAGVVAVIVTDDGNDPVSP